MRRTWNDIRSAWPRERRFTWRGWVLLGVLGVLVIAAKQGWNPVHGVMNSVVELWGTGSLYPLGTTFRMTMMVFLGQFVVSVPTMLGIIPAAGLVRPART